MKPTLPLLAALLALPCACGEPPPPEVPKVNAPAPVPPPPKCDSLESACVAKGDSKARLPGLDWTVSPPKGWRYAELADVTVAEKGKDSGPVLAVASFAPPKASWELKKARLDAIEQVAKTRGVQLAFKNVADVHVRRPDVPDTLDIAGVKLSIWEQEGAKRGGVSGNVVVIVGTVDEREVALVAFVPKADSAEAEADSQAVSEAIQSLAFKRAESKSTSRDGKKKGEGGKP